MIEEIKDRLSEENPDALTADGFDDAAIGILRRFGMDPIVVYDYNKCVQILMDRDGMSREDALEYLEYNTLGAWVGEGTPAFVEHPAGPLDQVLVKGKANDCPKRKRTAKVQAPAGSSNNHHRKA